MNNVVYYSYFDTVINAYLVSAGGLDIARGTVIGLSVESHCQYLAPLAFPPLRDGSFTSSSTARRESRSKFLRKSGTRS